MRAHQRVSMQAQTMIEPFGLPAGEFDVVMTLGNTAGLRMCDLAARMLTSAPNVTRLVKSLEARGLVERRRNPDSEREVIATLTTKGEAVFREAYPQVYAAWTKIFDAIYSRAEQKQLAALLERLTQTS